MKIIITGSLGNISKPLTIQLVNEGHEVTVISSDEQKREKILELSAQPAIGNLEDKDFIYSTLASADVVYCMIPPLNYFDPNLDPKATVHKITQNYVTAIKDSSIKKVIFLSSIGAHLSKGNGIISTYYDAEQLFNRIPGIAVTFIRPTSFYNNLLMYRDMIDAGFIAANYGADVIRWVSPTDIAKVIAAEITVSNGKKVVYVTSDEQTGQQTASLIGIAMGNVSLQWRLISDDNVQSYLEEAGMSRESALGLVQMHAASRDTKFWEDYNLNKPDLKETIKLEAFVEEYFSN